jgi:hypothetical protein
MALANQLNPSEDGRFLSTELSANPPEPHPL